MLRNNAGNPRKPGRKKALIAILAACCGLVYIPLLLRGGGGPHPASAQDDEAPVGTASGAGTGDTTEQPRDLGRPKAALQGPSPVSPSGPAARASGPQTQHGTETSGGGEGLCGPGGRAAAGGDDPRLTGILAFGRDRMAVLDGRVVRAGDRVRGYRVDEIREGEVILRSKEGRLTVPLIQAAGAGSGDRKSAEDGTEPPR
jgi:hypothetical protein